MEDCLNRLGVLTDLTEFAEKQKEKGSHYTAGWADYTTLSKWYETIGYLRLSLSEDVLKEFDEGRKGHNPGCKCIICTD